MALPQAIQQASEEAEALQAQMYTVAEEAVPAGDHTDTENAVPEAESNVVDLPRQSEPVPVETPRAAEPAEDAGYWKQKFLTLQGKFNAEVPQLHQQVREQGNKLARLTELLEAQRETPAPDATQDSNDEEEYGTSWVATVDRRAEARAKQLVALEVAKLRKEFSEVQEQVGQVNEHVAQTASEKFWAGVMTLVPDWKSVDADPAWIDWLDTTPEFSMDTYRSMASRAISMGDAQKIASLVKQFRGPQAALPAPPPAVNPELLRQVSPSTSRASPPPPQTGRIWSAAEYQSAMDVRNVQRFGKVESDRLEAEANHAVAEGRVRWG